MSEVYLPLISALVGAIIGAAAAVLTVYLQLKSLERRDRVHQAAALASEERAFLIDKSEKEKTKLILPPMSLFIDHYVSLLKVVEKDGLTPRAIRRLQARRDKLWDFAVQLEADRKKKEQGTES